MRYQLCVPQVLCFSSGPDVMCISQEDLALSGRLALQLVYSLLTVSCDLHIIKLTLLSVASPADSPCVRRMILEYGYNPLAAVTRSRNAAWNVPKARLIEFGLVFEV